MHYTRNTRIKVVKKMYTEEYTAQVEYVYPIIGLKVWEDIDTVTPSFIRFILGAKDEPLPWQASKECIWDEKLEDVTGLEWAKAVIDKYQELCDESDFTPKTEYIMYP